MPVPIFNPSTIKFNFIPYPSTSLETQPLKPIHEMVIFSNVMFVSVLIWIGLFASTQGIGVCSGSSDGTEYMCVDWSFGSEKMALAQYQYKMASGEDVFFGVGSYGSKSSYNIGKCYKFELDPPTKPIIAQVTNFGADVRNNQFDMVSLTRKVKRILFSSYADLRAPNVFDDFVFNFVSKWEAEDSEFGTRAQVRLTRRMTIQPLATRTVIESLVWILNSIV